MSVVEPGPGAATPPSPKRGRFAWRARLAALIGLVAIGAVAAATVSGRVWLRDANRSVTVRMTVVYDSAEVFVNCGLAGQVDEDRKSGRFDLGWLRPDDRVSVALKNVSQQDVSLSFRMFVNGEKRESFDHGSQASSGLPAGSHRPFVLEKTYAADGDPIGDAGCQAPKFVSLQIPHYMLLTEEQPNRAEGATAAGQPGGGPPGGRPHHRPDRSWDWLDHAGTALPWVVVGLGLLLGGPLLMGEVWRRTRSLTAAALEALLVGLGVVGGIAAVGALHFLLFVGLFCYLVAVAVLLAGVVGGGSSPAGSESR